MPAVSLAVMNLGSPILTILLFIHSLLDLELLGPLHSVVDRTCTPEALYRFDLIPREREGGTLKLRVETLARALLTHVLATTACDTTAIRPSCDSSPTREVARRSNRRRVVVVTPSYVSDDQ